MEPLAFRRPVAGPVEVAWEVVSDMAAFGDAAPGLSKAEVVEGHGEGMELSRTTLEPRVHPKDRKPDPARKLSRRDSAGPLWSNPYELHCAGHAFQAPSNRRHR